MKTKILLLFPLFAFPFKTFGQESTGSIKVLVQTKTSIESKIKNLTSIDVASPKYYELYQKYKDLYFEMLPLYDGYRADLTDCTLTSGSTNNFRSCLRSSAKEFAKPLQKLDNFYKDNKPEVSYQKDNQSGNKSVENMSQDLIGITSIVTALVNGGITVYDYWESKIKNQKKEFRDEINDKRYNLADFKDLLPLPTYKAQEKK